MVRGAFRQARPLAEGQKSADVKHDFTIPPPSANQDSWRRGSNFPRDMQIFRPSRHHLAEGVEFPEKNAGRWLLRPSLGGGVAMLLLLILPAVYGSGAAEIWESDAGRDVLAFFASLTSRWQGTRRSNLRLQTDLGPAGFYFATLP